MKVVTISSFKVYFTEDVVSLLSYFKQTNSKKT